MQSIYVSIEWNVKKWEKKNIEDLAEDSASKANTNWISIWQKENATNDKTYMKVLLLQPTHKGVW